MHLKIFPRPLNNDIFFPGSLFLSVSLSPSLSSPLLLSLSLLTFVLPKKLCFWTLYESYPQKQADSIWANKRDLTQSSSRTLLVALGCVFTFPLIFTYFRCTPAPLVLFTHWIFSWSFAESQYTKCFQLTFHETASRNSFNGLKTPTLNIFDSLSHC